MCIGCNPFCGRCKPPLPRPRKCPDCGRFTMDTAELVCSNCGAELPKPMQPKTEFCNFSGQMCANPCGQRFRHVKTYVNCANRTIPA